MGNRSKALSVLGKARASVLKKASDARSRISKLREGRSKEGPVTAEARALKDMLIKVEKAAESVSAAKWTSDAASVQRLNLLED